MQKRNYTSTPEHCVVLFDTVISTARVSTFDTLLLHLLDINGRGYCPLFVETYFSGIPPEIANCTSPSLFVWKRACKRLTTDLRELLDLCLKSCGTRRSLTEGGMMGGTETRTSLCPTPNCLRAWTECVREWEAGVIQKPSGLCFGPSIEYDRAWIQSVLTVCFNFVHTRCGLWRGRARWIKCSLIAGMLIIKSGGQSNFLHGHEVVAQKPAQKQGQQF